MDAEAMAEMPFSRLLPTKRKFRADFYLPKYRTVIEINGGQFMGGRHNRGGKGYETDLYKLNLAQLYGYKVFQFTYEMLERREYLNFINKKLFEHIQH